MISSSADRWRRIALSWSRGSNRAEMFNGQDLPENESQTAQWRRQQIIDDEHGLVLHGWTVSCSIGRLDRIGRNYVAARDRRC
jgi:hypothetical protein